MPPKSRRRVNEDAIVCLVVVQSDHRRVLFKEMTLLLRAERN